MTQKTHKVRFLPNLALLPLMIVVFLVSNTSLFAIEKNKHRIGESAEWVNDILHNATNRNEN